MLFAALILPREPLQWTQLVSAIHLWLQNAGAVAALGLGIWLLAQFLQRRQPFADALTDVPRPLAGPLSNLLTGLACLSLVGFLLVVGLGIVASFSPLRLGRYLPTAGREANLTVGDYILSASGLLALGVALTPMFFGLLRLRWRRIWALARLSLKEAVRNRVVIVFGLVLLVFLFAGWFLPSKAEDQVRTYVWAVYFSIWILFLMLAGLLGSLSIPNDIKSQSIHTIVTKPVEKFEIVLGRFLGYGLLLTAGIVAVSLLSLVYVARGISDQAREESYKARVPIFGQLQFWGTRDPLKGESVGREFDRRGYISGIRVGDKETPRQYAIWTYESLPAELASRESPIRFEFTFDIFRLSKGEEGKAIPCTFLFADGSLDLRQIQDKLAEIQEKRDKRPRADDPDEDKKLSDAFEREVIEKYGVYELRGEQVTDYHTQSQEIPAALFKRLAAEHKDPNVPQMRVWVSVDPAPEVQMLGAARRDFYLLAADRSFEVNFLKGVVGMWCSHMLVLGIAVACSTYLSGIISWLCTMFLFGAGLFTEYLQQLAENRIQGGGPLQSAWRVMTSRQMAAPLDESPGATVMVTADRVFTWILGRLLNLIPDVNRFDLHMYVANGFDVSLFNVLLIDNLIPLVGYLLPWAILAYYLMKYREIANPT